MGIKEHFEKNAFNYLGLSLITTGVFLLSSYFIVKNKKDEINNNWEKSRCEPTIMPFVSLFREYENGAVKGTMDNFNKCLYKISRSYMDRFMAPLHSLMESLHKIIDALKDSINNIRKFFLAIRHMLLNVILEITQRIEDTLEVIHTIFIKNMELLKKQKGIAQVITYSLVSIAFTIFSMFNSVGRVIKIFIQVLIALGWLVLFFCCSPVLGVLSGWAAGVGLHWVCFDKDTPITLSDGTKRKISLINVGDKTMFGGKVTGIFKFDSKDVDMYRYKNTIVSGCHSIYYNNKWIRVKDCSEAEKLNKKQWNKPHIYCLSTENNVLLINNDYFADYFESSDPELIYKLRNKQLNIINDIVNDDINDIEDNKREIYSDNYGFTYDTKLLLTNNTFKKIMDIDVGDTLMTHGKVLGIMKFKIDSNTELYKSNNIVVAGTTFINKDGKWDCVYNHPDFSLTENKYNFIYHILTEDGRLTADSYLFTDFNELSAEYNIDDIDDAYLDKMNNSRFTKNVLKSHQLTKDYLDSSDFTYEEILMF